MTVKSTVSMMGHSIDSSQNQSIRINLLRQLLQVRKGKKAESDV